MDRGILSHLLRRQRWRNYPAISSLGRFHHPAISSRFSTFVPNYPTNKGEKLQFQTHFAIPEELFWVRLKVEYGPRLSGPPVGYRWVHTTPSQDSDSKEKKPSSKVEETVNMLKKKQVDMDDIEKNEQNRIDITNEQKSGQVEEKASKDVAELPKKKSLWVKVKDEVKHYYSGFKLLFLDVRICSKIIWKLCRGGTLTRRENKQLVTTVGDLFRLVPFSVFIIVPFMEFLLPVALKLFPGLLPSTFTTSSERENKMKRTLKAKLEYAKFLQQTLDAMAPNSSSSRDSQSARDFVAFYKKVKEEGMQIKNKDILKFSQLFKDEITLDNMERNQLTALCRLLELTPMGTDNFLRFQLEMKLRQLKIDDRVIQREGVENMNVEELQNASRERGMRALGLSEKTLQRQLGQWLDLSLNKDISPSLLLLSRTLYLPDNLDATAQIAATIKTLPEVTATQTSAAIGEQEGKIRNVTRLEIIKEEQRKIEEEAAEAEVAKAEEEAKRQKELNRELQQIEDEAKKEIAMEEKASPVKQATDSASGSVEELVDLAKVLVDNAPEVSTETVVESAKAEIQKLKKIKAEEISASDLIDIKSAIEILGKAEKEDDLILDLRKELREYEDDVNELKFVKAASGRSDLQESKGARRLFGYVNRMLGQVDRIITDLEEKKSLVTEKSTKKKEDGEDPASSTAEEEEENQVSVHELIEAVQKLQTTSDKSKVDQIADVIARMDVDDDGIIQVDHVMKVIELLGRHHINISGKAIDQIVDMLIKEEMLAVESGIEEVLGKSVPDEKIRKKMVKKIGENFLSNNKSTLTMTRKEEEEEEQGNLDKVAKDLTEQEPEEHIKEMFQQEEKSKEFEEDKKVAKKASDNNGDGTKGGKNLK